MCMQSFCEKLQLRCNKEDNMSFYIVNQVTDIHQNSIETLGKNDKSQLNGMDFWYRIQCWF